MARQDPGSARSLAFVLYIRGILIFFNGKAANEPPLP